MNSRNYTLSGIVIMAIMLLITSCADREEQSLNLVKKGKKKLSMGLNDQAMDYFEDAIRKDRKNYEAWHLKGSCRITSGEFHESLEDFDKAIELKPDYAPAYYNRGMAWFYIGDQEKACEDWKMAESIGYMNISDKTRHCN